MVQGALGSLVQAHGPPLPEVLWVAPGLNRILPAHVASNSYHVGRKICYSRGPTSPGHLAGNGSLKGGGGPGDLGQSLLTEGQARCPGLGTPEGHWPHTPAAGQQTLAVGVAACGQSRVGNPLPKGLRGPLPAQEQPVRQTGTQDGRSWLHCLPGPGLGLPEKLPLVPLQCLEHLYHLHPQGGHSGATSQQGHQPGSSTGDMGSSPCPELRAHQHS